MFRLGRLNQAWSKLRDEKKMHFFERIGIFLEYIIPVDTSLE